MPYSLSVDLQCPMCDDGVLTATVDRESITDLVGTCGHAEAAWQDLTPGLVTSVWEAVEEADARRYDDAMTSRYEAWRDR